MNQDRIRINICKKIIELSKIKCNVSKFTPYNTYLITNPSLNYSITFVFNDNELQIQYYRTDTIKISLCNPKLLQIAANALTNIMINK